MNSTITHAEPEPNYPLLKIFNGMVVLFTEPKKGTLVHDKYSPTRVGEVSDGWAEGCFVPFPGTITLEN